MSGTEPLLEIEGLSAHYGAVRALDNVTLSVPERQLCAILGANGAGKSTLLRTLTGLHRRPPAR